MKKTIRAALLVALLSGTLSARQGPALTLKEHVAASPLIVIGSINSLEGRKPSIIGGVRYLWDSELHFTEVLKGSPSKPLLIRWSEVNLDGRPEYKIESKLIWFLMKNPKDGSYYAARSDSIQPLKTKRKIKELLKQGALPNHSVERPAAQ